MPVGPSCSVQWAQGGAHREQKRFSGEVREEMHRLEPAREPVPG